jgi:hypothetical protein
LSKCCLFSLDKDEESALKPIAHDLRRYHRAVILLPIGTAWDIGISMDEEDTF